MLLHSFNGIKVDISLGFISVIIN